MAIAGYRFFFCVVEYLVGRADLPENNS